MLCLNLDMTATPKYPTITDATLVPLRAIDIQLKEFPDLLMRAECPYPPAIRLFLQRLAGGGAVASVVYSDDDTIQEVADLYTELKRVAFKAGQVAGGDTKDQVGVLKTTADLLGKMVDLRAKAFSVRDMARFQKAVVEMLEAVCTPAQRTDFIDRMGAYQNV